MKLINSKLFYLCVLILIFPILSVQATSNDLDEIASFFDNMDWYYRFDVLDDGEKYIESGWLTGEDDDIIDFYIFSKSNSVFFIASSSHPLKSKKRNDILELINNNSYYFDIPMYINDNTNTIRAAIQFPLAGITNIGLFTWRYMDLMMDDFDSIYSQLSENNYFD